MVALSAAQATDDTLSSVPGRSVPVRRSFTYKVYSRKPVTSVE
jgi:hypothetical protein